MESPGPVQLSAREVLQLTQRYFAESDENNLKIVNYEFKTYSSDPQGFLSKHLFLLVLVQRKCKSGPTDYKLKFFTKSSPTHSEALTKYTSQFAVFEKECNVYRLLLPRLQDINIAAGNFAAKCFLARKDILVFENLNENGYRLGSSRNTILDYEHLRCALKALANMHSASIVLESRAKKSLLQLYPQCLKENAYPDDPNNIRRTTFGKACESLCALIKLIPKYRDSPELNRIIGKFLDLFEQIFEFVKPSKTYRNTFAHADLWANNLLFLYDESNKKRNVPLQCKLVDYQLARYAPPALDILTVLTIPTSSEFRKQHLNELLDDYYQYMDDFLAAHSINIQDEIPVKQFKDSVNYFKLAGLIESCLFSHLTILPPEMTADICNDSEHFEEFLTKERTAVCTKAFENDALYRERLTDMISDIVDIYILGSNQL